MKGQDNVDKIYKQNPRHNFNEFEIRQIVKMDPGYHTSHPYYFLIVDISESAYHYEQGIVMITTIPGAKVVHMDYYSFISYHWRRMTIIGPCTDENKHLLYNQSLT